MLSIRKIGVISRTYRHLNRYRQILAVLIRYGFGDLVDHLRLEQYLEAGLQLISFKRGERVERLSRAERFRLSLEELGPTFIKFGQVLSTRPDLISNEFLTELARLQDNVPPEPFDTIRAALNREFHGCPETIFHKIEETPLASASIGQVHQAELVDGDQVAVKIQRTGIQKIVEVDLEIMLHLATLMERHIEELSLHRPVRIVEEFTRAIERELDYTIEAGNMERIGGQFLGDPTVYIPRVYREASTIRVLTTEYVQGIKISEVGEITDAGMDLKRICDRGAQVCLKQIFVHGFFHADPHPGNIHVLPGNIICLLDFGLVGDVDRRTREVFVTLIDGIVRQDPLRVTEVLLALTEYEEPPSQREVERDVADYLTRYLYKPLQEIDFGHALQQLLELVSRHHMRIPADIFLMIKALGTVEGIARVLNPDFNLVATAAPFIKKVMLTRYSPERITQNTVALLKELTHFADQFPKDLLEITRLLRRQKLTLQVADPELETTLSKFDQISNRIAFAIVLAALLIGSALIVISQIPPLLYGISLIGIIGFLAAAIMGVWLLIAILKKGRL